MHCSEVELIHWAIDPKIRPVAVCSLTDVIVLVDVEDVPL